MRQAGVILFGVIVAAALATGAWELHRLDSRVQSLRAEVRNEAVAGPGFERATKNSLADLRKDAVRIRESGLRQEFQSGVYAGVLGYIVAMYTGNTSCRAANQAWKNYVNDTEIPYINKHPDLKRALRHDDPDYEATLLNTFPRCGA